MAVSAPRIAVAGADDVVVEGLRRILSGRFRLISVWSSVSDALSGPARSDLAAILVDISSNVYPFVDDAQRLRKHFLGSRIVLTAESWESAPVLGAMQSEVDGFVLQTIRSEVVVKTLELILLGERMFPTRPNRGVSNGNGRLSDAVPHHGDPPLHGLSVRELEVLRLLAQGNPNKVIARDLGIAEATVKAHVKAILRKADARNRTQVALWARELGFCT